MIALDTSTIIDIFKKEKQIQEILERINEQLSSTVINHQEIFFGLPHNENKYSESDYYDSFFNDIIVLSFDVPASKKSSEIYWRLKKRGVEIGKFDCMIAGILLSKGIRKIITKNVKHFSQIKELEVLSY